VLLHEKRRSPAAPGSIPDVLDIFRCEVRFYQEIAPVIGVRVPACYRAEATDDGTLLELEDLSSWQPGADPASAARVLARLHELWPGQTLSRWPWLRQPGPALDAGVDLLAALYDRTWPLIAGRTELGTRSGRDRSGLAARLLGPARLTQKPGAPGCAPPPRPANPLSPPEAGPRFRGSISAGQPLTLT
jgi:hypothetical protein